MQVYCHGFFLIQHLVLRWVHLSKMRLYLKKYIFPEKFSFYLCCLQKLLIFFWLVEFFPEKYRWIFKFNPLSVFINAYREVLLAGGFPNWGSLSIGVIISVVLFIFSFKMFKKLEGVFADIV